MVMTDDEGAPARTALVLYGTETGNSQDVADELGRLVERLHFMTRVSELNSVKADSLSNYGLTIFVVSTTGQGEFTADAKAFWKTLLLKRLPPTFLQSVNFVLFGLGDSSYPKFNWAARKLHKRLIQLGANEIYPSGEADEQHPEGLEGLFVPWSLDFRKHLLDRYPLLPGQHPIPDDIRLPPKWLLGLQDGTVTEKPSPSNIGRSSVADSVPREPAELAELVRLDNDVRPIPDSVSAKLTSNSRVTPKNHWQDVRHLSLEVPESIPYSPGDMLSIMPKNFDEDVNTLISLMGWEPYADRLISFVPDPSLSQMPEPPPPQIPYLRSHTPLTMRDLLTDYLDITAIPRRSFFSNISHFTDDPMHKERLLEFTDPEYIDEYYDYATRPRRSILEILHEFSSVKIPWQEVAAVFPVLRGRQFSLASGGELKRGSNGGTKFELLVAIVKYQTVIKKIRQGVCTRYLSVLRPGSTLKIQVQRGGLSSSINQIYGPTVLVGPGTGLAPLRSLIWEKAAIAKTCREKKAAGESSDIEIGPTVLLFGGRNRHADYFFEAEWEQLKKEIDLQVLTAFSRDQRHKIYVQDLIRERFSLFFNLLHDQLGTVYVCGSSGKMPQAIREALIESFQGQEGGTGYDRQMAEKYLVDMEKVGRYKQETW
ncbi:NAPDH-dependent diflavin reductase [Arachnomyces sp. PD_36]|nr:NAPDH-dependent diflavin reductase [Arachnomyces sp. PD_36]